MGFREGLLRGMRADRPRKRKKKAELSAAEKAKLKEFVRSL